MLGGNVWLAFVGLLEIVSKRTTDRKRLGLVHWNRTGDSADLSQQRNNAENDRIRGGTIGKSEDLTNSGVTSAPDAEDASGKETVEPG